MKKRTGRKTGFTLIELMVVVAIMGIMAACAIPPLARLAGSQAREARETAARAEEESKREAAAAPPAAQPSAPGLPPDIASADIAMRLSVTHARFGLEVFPRYQAAVEGRLLLASDGSQEPTRLFYPFPAGTIEARDVFLRFLDGDRKEEASDVVYDKRGIHWTGRLPKGLRQAEIAFVAYGRDRFIQTLPPSRRTRALNVRVDLAGVSPEAIPEHGLQPTGVQGQRVWWTSQNLVSDRDIVVEIPPSPGPLGRLSQLFRYVGLAVLLFGAGFWYLNERAAPGRLDRFGWWPFMLLASTYCLFFVNLAVLGYHGHLGTGFALGVAAATSLPLLVLHVSRLVDARFAWTRALPLAMLTLGVVVNGVYGGALRSYVFMGAGYIALSYLTLTCPVPRLRTA